MSIRKLVLLLVLLGLPLMAQTPVLDSCGATYESATLPSAHSVTAPATINAGDLLIFSAIARNGNSDIAVSSPPADFTLIDANNCAASGSLCTVAYRKSAVGDEDGTSISITFTGGTTTDAVIGNICRYTASGGFAVSPIADTDLQNSADSPLTGPTLTATGNNQLAVYVVGFNANPSTLDSMASATGGTWTERVDVGTGTVIHLNIQDAPLDTGGTISGGSDAFTSTPDTWRAVGFILATPAVAGGGQKRRGILQF